MHIQTARKRDGQFRFYVEPSAARSAEVTAVSCLINDKPLPARASASPARGVKKVDSANLRASIDSSFLSHTSTASSNSISAGRAERQQKLFGSSIVFA